MEKLTKYTQLEHLQKTNELVDEVNKIAGEIPQNLIYSSTPEGGKFFFRYNKPQEEGGGSEDVLLVGSIPLAKNCDSNSSGLLLGSESDDIDLIKNTFVHDLSSKVQDDKLIIEGYRGKGSEDTNKFTVEIPVSKLALTGSYNDLTDIPELTSEEIVEALGYTPFNPTTGGDISGNINLTNDGKYLINGEELESGINLLKRSKEYNIGDIAFSKELKSLYHLKCIVAGTTAAEEPADLPSKLLNDEFEDGTAKWKVVSYSNHLENYLFVGNEEDLEEDKIHENMIIVSPEELIDPVEAMVMVGATEELDGKGGLVPAAQKGAANRYLSSDGTWKQVDIPEVSKNLSEYTNDVGYIKNTDTMVGSNGSNAGKSGLVPAPAAEDKDKYLKGDGTWAVINTDIEGYSIGDIAYRPYLKSGWVKANGATVQRSAYPRLVQFATDHNLWTSNPTGEPWKFGNGDGSTTMVLPDYRNRVIQGGDSSAVIQAGLPNIEGYAFLNSSLSNRSHNFSGAFQSSSVSGYQGSSIQDCKGDLYLRFNASNSNSIYGKSTTVQPSSTMLISQIKY